MNSPISGDVSLLEILLETQPESFAFEIGQVGDRGLEREAGLDEAHRGVTATRGVGERLRLSASLPATGASSDMA